MGLDLLRLRLQPSEGRLVMTPRRDDTVAGDVPMFAWSTDPADGLPLEVDREGVSDWDAIADTATLVYEAVNLGVETGVPGLFAEQRSPSAATRCPSRTTSRTGPTSSPTASRSPASC